MTRYALSVGCAPARAAATVALLMFGGCSAEPEPDGGTCADTCDAESTCVDGVCVDNCASADCGDGVCSFCCSEDCVRDDAAEDAALDASGDASEGPDDAGDETDGSGATDDGPGATDDGSGATDDGPGATDDGPSDTDDGPGDTDDGSFESPHEAACTGSGGTVTTSLCCTSAAPLPNLCAIGACGCAPDFSADVSICDCGEGRCFDGAACVDQ